MTSAFLLINCDIGFVVDVTDHLQRIPEITEVYKVQGIYDIIALINSSTEEGLNEVLMNQIRKIDRIKSTMTVIIAEGKEWKKNKV